MAALDKKKYLSFFQNRRFTSTGRFTNPRTFPTTSSSTIGSPAYIGRLSGLKKGFMV